MVMRSCGRSWILCFDEYVKEGVAELDQSKLPQLLALRYRAVNDAARELGGTARIRETFVGFQKHLYARLVEPEMLHGCQREFVGALVKSL